MKTIKDLNALIPTLKELLRNNKHEIGESYLEQDEDGCGCCSSTYTTNYFNYEDDGWCIEINYNCAGEWKCDPGDYWNHGSRDLIKAWGSISEITAYHYDEDTGEEIMFSDNDLTDLWCALDDAISELI